MPALLPSGFPAFALAQIIGHRATLFFDPTLGRCCGCAQHIADICVQVMADSLVGLRSEDEPLWLACADRVHGMGSNS